MLSILLYIFIAIILVIAIFSIFKKSSGVSAQTKIEPISFGNQGTETLMSEINPYNGFEMTIDDKFMVKGRGLILTGTIKLGEIRIGDIIKCENGKKAKIVGIEMYLKKSEKAIAGENVGLVLEGLDREDVEVGQAITI